MGAVRSIEDANGGQIRAGRLAQATPEMRKEPEDGHLKRVGILLSTTGIVAYYNILKHLSGKPF